MGRRGKKERKKDRQREINDMAWIHEITATGDDKQVRTYCRVLRSILLSAKDWNCKLEPELEDAIDASI
jgi:hypothetical protein